jgi:tRNA A37 threonylcarbamoyladenosine synthetase subunit TsaC/SUA5/YrdC
MNELAGPMVSTSANISGDRPLLDTTDIRKRKYFSLEQDLMVLNMGPLPHSLPSTVIDCSRKTVEILREGAIPFREIERILPGVTVNVHT